MGKNQMCELEKSRCSGSCDRCGWNKRERAWREALLRKNGLTLCKDGVYRLIIK